MEKKYIILKDRVKHCQGKTLYGIQALKDFGHVRKGSIGGYIEKEENLSQEGNCWVYNEAMVFDEAKVYGDARIHDYAKVYGDAEVYGKAGIYDEARVMDSAIIHGNAQVMNRALIGDAAEVFGNAQVTSRVIVIDHAKVYGNAIVSNNSTIYGNVNILGDTHIFGNADIGGDAIIKSDRDYYIGKNIWSSGRFFTYTRSNRLWKVGCFYGTGKELIEKAYQDGPVSGREYERVVNYVEAMYFDLEKD